MTTESAALLALSFSVLALTVALVRVVWSLNSLVRHAFNVVAVPPRDQLRRIAEETRANEPPRHGPDWMPPRPEFNHKAAFEETIPLTSDGGRGPE